MHFAEFARRVSACCPVTDGEWVLLRAIESTQLLARRIAREYLKESQSLTAINLVAWQQLQGRGRQERAWSSPPGAGLYLTLIRTLSGPDELQRLPMMVAVALCTLVNQLLHQLRGPRVLERGCRVKWPNDLMVDGRKVGGILIEALGPREEPVALVGIGLNYRADLAIFAQPQAASLLHEAGVPEDQFSLAEFALQAVRAVDAGLQQDSLPGELIHRYQELSAHHWGERLSCRLPAETVEGTFLGFDAHGFLRLEVQGRERILAAGELIAQL